MLLLVVVAFKRKCKNAIFAEVISYIFSGVISFTIFQKENVSFGNKKNNENLIKCYTGKFI